MESYVAVFNISDTAQTVHYRWSDLGLSAPDYRLRDLWTHTNIGSAASLEITLPPHASVLYRAVPLDAKGTYGTRFRFLNSEL